MASSDQKSKQSPPETLKTDGDLSLVKQSHPGGLPDQFFLVRGHDDTLLETQTTFGGDWSVFDLVKEVTVETLVTESSAPLLLWALREVADE